MVNVLRNERRREAIVPQVPSGDNLDLEAFKCAGSAQTPERALVEAAYDDEVQTALLRLPDEYREVVLLCDVSELSYREVSEALGCPVGTVRSRLSRGRQMLFESLESFANAHRPARAEAKGAS
jgi:RNA polymerase sigma-70 factor (ECF subfamily)